MAETNKILVEVAYAKEDEQVIIPLNVDAGTTLEQAIRAERTARCPTG